MPNLVEIAQNAAEIWRFSIFQDGDRPPCWICCVSDWTTHEGRLVVFITMQNLVGIDTAVSINTQVLVFCDFGLKTPIYAPFWGGFGGTFPPKNVTHRPNSKKDRPWVEPRHLSHKA